MSTNAKSSPSVSPTSAPSSTPIQHREKGIRIFMWPKVIFLYPTAIVALICSLGMSIIHDRTHDPTKSLKAAVDAKHLTPERHLERRARHDMTRSTGSGRRKICSRCSFWRMFAFNLLVMALDFPAVLARRRDPRRSSSACSSFSGWARSFTSTC